MRATLKTAPAAEPVSVAELKNHAKIEVDDDDTLIATYIAAARQMAEAYTDRVFVSQSWDIYTDRFPTCWDFGHPDIVLPKSPLLSVTALEYRPTDTGAYTALVLGTDFEVGPGYDPARLVLMPAKSWPATGARSGAVHIEAVFGYGNAGDVPDGIRQAIMVLAADMYDNRSPVPTTFADQQMRRLLGPFVLGRLY